MLTTTRRWLLRAARALELVLPIRVSLSHFYSYRQLIADPVWLRVIERDASIRKARRLSIRTLDCLLDDWDGAAAVRALHKPLLIMQGRNDAFQPHTQSDILFSAAHEPKRRVLLDTGHMPHLEDPRGVADLIAEWATRSGQCGADGRAACVFDGPS